MEIDNQLFLQEDINWWDDDPDSHHVLLRHSLNPVRFNYFQRLLEERGLLVKGMTILDLGCGGGFLSEEFAKAGLTVTGLDPSPVLVRTAREHGKQGSLDITYVEGYGEKLPFESGSFDLVACCDVLEHVDDLDRVMAEISRVLRPEGIFFFDTINRTFISWLFIIKIAQDWNFTAWEAPRTHAFDKFVKPSELDRLMTGHGLSLGEIKGISPAQNPLASLLTVRKRAQGRITRQAMGAALRLQESKDIKASYLGYAVKD